MTSFLPDSLIFESPTYFWSALLIPLLWWLLRLIPPEAVRRRFPSFHLLRNLPPMRAQTAYTPIWLLILRGVMMLFLITGFASPVWNVTETDNPPPDQPTIILFDNCWSAAPNLKNLREKSQSLLDNLPPEQNIAIIVTCPANSNPILSNGLITTPAARALLRKIKAVDKIADWQNVLAAMRSLELSPIANVGFISSGMLEKDKLDRLLKEFLSYDHVTVFLPPKDRLPMHLTASIEKKNILAKLHRFTDSGDAHENIITQDAAGRILAVDDIDLPDGRDTHTIPLNIPPESMHDIASITVRNRGALAHLNWQVPIMPARIGIIPNTVFSLPVLQPDYYLRAALKNSEIVEGDWPELISQNLTAVISPSPDLPAQHMNEIYNWVQNGGTLVRFMDSKIPKQIDGLMPARPIKTLYHSPGMLLNLDPLGLASFPDDSPLAKLHPISAPKFYWHTLINPDDLAGAKTLASFTDATPMILEKSFGKGRSILITTPPTPLGGNWVLGSAFPDMLKTILTVRERDVVPSQLRDQINPALLTVLKEADFPQAINVSDLTINLSTIRLAPYLFAIAVLLWIVDQALIILRFAGIPRAHQ